MRTRRRKRTITSLTKQLQPRILDSLKQSSFSPSLKRSTLSSTWMERKTFGSSSQRVHQGEGASSSTSSLWRSWIYASKRSHSILPKNTWKTHLLSRRWSLTFVNGYSLLIGIHLQFGSTRNLISASPRVTTTRTTSRIGLYTWPTTKWPSTLRVLRWHSPSRATCGVWRRWGTTVRRNSAGMCWKTSWKSSQRI